VQIKRIKKETANQILHCSLPIYRIKQGMWYVHDLCTVLVEICNFYGPAVSVLTLVQEVETRNLPDQRWHIDICELEFCHSLQDVVYHEWDAAVTSAINNVSEGSF
jgi:hypothetical protein